MNNFEKIINLIAQISKLNVNYFDLETNALLTYSHFEVPPQVRLSEEDYKDFEKELIKKKNECYLYKNFDLEYLIYGIWKENKCTGVIVVGPFMTSILSEEDVYKIKDEEMKDFYKKVYYEHLESLDLLARFIVNLNYENYQESSILIKDKKVNKREIDLEFKENRTITDFRYSCEQKIMEAISNGDSEEALEIYFDNHSLFEFPNRNPGKYTRTIKNNLIILNTLSRKAAEEGGLSPKYLHKISEGFAIEIENSNNLFFLKELEKKILLEYSSAVREYRSENYSTNIKKSINYIFDNLEKKISLEEIANNIYINPHHLSRQFKKETGKTITEYINWKKIERAKVYLKKDKLTIVEVSFKLGFTSEAYFNKVFKKYTGTTPAKYLKLTE